MKLATAPRASRVFTGNLLMVENAVRVAGMTNTLERADFALRSFLPERVKRCAYRKELLVDEMVENTSTLNSMTDSRKLYPDEWSDDLETFTPRYEVRVWYIIGRCYGFAFATDTQQYLNYKSDLLALVDADNALSSELTNSYALGVEHGRKDKKQRDEWQKRKRIEALQERNHPVFGDYE